MVTNYKEYVNGVDQRIGTLFKAAPRPMGAYGNLVQAVSESSSLDNKYKELMALAISISIRCEDCIAFHTRAAINHGATKDNVLETIAVAVEMGGGPGAVYGAKALQAYTDLVT